MNHFTDKLNTSKNNRYLENYKANYQLNYAQDDQKTNSSRKINTLSRDKMLSSHKLESSMI